VDTWARASFALAEVLLTPKLISASSGDAATLPVPVAVIPYSGEPDGGLTTVVVQPVATTPVNNRATAHAAADPSPRIIDLSRLRVRSRAA
jgi:hypothetical protein